MTLKEIFADLNHFAVKWEPYFEIYERHMNQYRGKPVTLVEIGVLKGGSLEMWSKYLGPQSRIIGIDTNRDCLKFVYDESNISIEIGDQSSKAFWDDFLLKYPSIDILVDDGGHRMEQQIVTFENVFPKMNMNGTFICEDCHTSYFPGHGGNLKQSNTFIEYSKSIVDDINKDWHGYRDNKQILTSELTSVHFYDSVVVFEKFGKKLMKNQNQDFLSYPNSFNSDQTRK